VKLCDFSCTLLIEKTFSQCLSDQFQAAMNSSISWMAPEVIKQAKYGRKADIWSFGCCLIEIKTARNPWSEYCFDYAVEAILKIAVSNDLTEIPDDVSENLFDFIKMCL
jgi:mitogen-activated protein kinase kinase kinase